MRSQARAEPSIESCITAGTRARETSPLSREKRSELFRDQQRNQYGDTVVGGPQRTLKSPFDGVVARLLQKK